MKRKELLQNWLIKCYWLSKIETLLLLKPLQKPQESRLRSKEKHKLPLLMQLKLSKPKPLLNLLCKKPLKISKSNSKSRLISRLKKRQICLNKREKLRRKLPRRKKRHGRRKFKKILNSKSKLNKPD